MGRLREYKMEPIKIKTYFQKQDDHWLYLSPGLYKMPYKEDDVRRTIESICKYCLNRPGFLRNDGDKLEDYNKAKDYLINEILSLEYGEDIEISVTIDLSFEKFAEK